MSVKPVFVMYLLMAILLFLMCQIEVNDHIQYEDDGSSERHLVTSSTLAFVSSAIVPFSGYFVAVDMGILNESGNTGIDTQRDLFWNGVGAKIGSKYGSVASLSIIIIFVTVIIMIAVRGKCKQYKRRKKRERKEKRYYEI